VCWTPWFFPLGDWHQVPVVAVQAGLRRLFARWGLPDRLRLDNGYPWGASSLGGLPPDLILWLLGLEPIRNRPRHCEENGKVERGHGVLKAWAEPARCADTPDLARRLTWAATMQRAYYPALAGRSRQAAYPAVVRGGRPYDPATEPAVWDVSRVWAYLAQGVWPRRVDRHGHISLYNRSIPVGRTATGTEVQVRFAATDQHWVISDATGNVLRRHPAPELAADRICTLAVTRKKPGRAPTGEVQLLGALVGGQPDTS
jgi:hypothetical protein